MRYVIVLMLTVFLNTVSLADPCGVYCKGGLASGTTIEGAPPGRTWVVTNRHVVAVWQEKILLHGKTYPAKLLNVSEVDDVALVEIDASLPASPLAKTDPERGVVVKLQGNGQRSGGFDKVRVNKLTSVRRQQLLTDMFISPGDSGSGLLNDSGELVGVIWGCRGQGGGPGIGIPVSAVKAILPVVITKNMNYRF